MGDLFDTPLADVRFPEPREFQQRAHQALREGVRAGHRKQLLVAPTGAGKCLGRGTPVLMFDGTIKAVEQVRVGDQLMGPDSAPRTVLSLAHGRERMYRVIPKKGDPYVVNASHILSLRKTPSSYGLRTAAGHIARDADVVNINVEAFARSGPTARHCLKGWRTGVEFAWRAVPLDPYFLGVWLGDGNLNSTQVSKPDEVILRACEAVAHEHGLRAVRTIAGTCPAIRLSGPRGGNDRPANPVYQKLQALGVTRGKHIPLLYRANSRAVRLQVLAGLLDTDGHLSRSGFDYISVDELLSRDLAWLARSLGFAAYVSECRKSCQTGVVGTYWRVSISGDCSEIPTRIARKRSPPRRQKKRHLVHGIRVEPLGEDDYFGFEINGDHLFLLGDFTVTHNTYLGLRVIYEALMKNRCGLFVCDRTALINQTALRADDYGLTRYGIIQADNPRRDNSQPFQIASVQTIQARGYWPPADVIVIDEAHTQYQAVREMLGDTPAAVVGLTATPCSKGLGLLYDNMVNAATMHELTQAGVLVPMRILTCVTPDMTGAATSGGEWTNKAASEREAQIIGDVVAEWQRHGEGRKTIAFGADIAYCTELVRRFNAAGIGAATYTSETPDGEREALLQEFSRPDPETRILVSVEALAKGFDVQDIGCVIDARPLRKSLSTAIQMWGRGLRSSPGKTDCILLDHSGNARRFHSDFVDVYFNGFKSLDDSEKLDDRPREEIEFAPTGCPQCGHKPFSRRCLSCGFEKPTRVLEDTASGVMQEIVIGSGSRKTVIAKDSSDLWHQLCTYAKLNIPGEKQAGWAWHKYRAITGHELPRGMRRYEEAPIVAVHPGTLNKLKSLHIAYRRGRAHAAA